MSLSLLDHFIPLGVMARALEPLPAAFGQRQGTPQNEWPAHCRGLCERLKVAPESDARECFSSTAQCLSF